MKLRKLIPAFALLLVSAVVMSTASFAWFSMNSSVSATNMQVKATASKNLLISNTGATGNFLTTVQMTGTAQSMNPASTVGADETNGTIKFYKVLPASSTTVNTDDGKYTATTQFTDAVSGTDYLKQTVHIKLTGTETDTIATNKLQAEVEATSGGAHALDASLRVMLVIKDVDAENTTPYVTTIFALQDVTTYKGIGGLTTGNLVDEVALKDVSPANKTANINTDFALTVDNAYQIDIYIWYEGQDPNCKSANAFDVTSTTIKVTFSAI